MNPKIKINFFFLLQTPIPLNNVVVYGLEIVRFLSCLKVALYVFDKMSQ